MEMRGGTSRDGDNGHPVPGPWGISPCHQGAGTPAAKGDTEMSPAAAPQVPPAGPSSGDTGVAVGTTLGLSPSPAGPQDPATHRSPTGSPRCRLAQQPKLG